MKDDLRSEWTETCGNCSLSCSLGFVCKFSLQQKRKAVTTFPHRLWIVCALNIASMLSYDDGNKNQGLQLNCSSHFTYTVDFPGNIYPVSRNPNLTGEGQITIWRHSPWTWCVHGPFPSRAVHPVPELCLAGWAASEPTVCLSPEALLQDAEHLSIAWMIEAYCPSVSPETLLVVQLQEKKAFLWKLEKSLKCLAGLKAFSCSTSCYLSAGSL